MVALVFHRRWKCKEKVVYGAAAVYLLFSEERVRDIFNSRSGRSTKMWKLSDILGRWKWQSVSGMSSMLMMGKAIGTSEKMIVKRYSRVSVLE